MHPIYRLIELCILFGGLAGAMYATANNFDETEIKTLAAFAGIWAGVRGTSALAGQLGGQKSSDN